MHEYLDFLGVHVVELTVFMVVHFSKDKKTIKKSPNNSGQLNPSSMDGINKGALRAYCFELDIRCCSIVSR